MIESSSAVASCISFLRSSVRASYCSFVIGLPSMTGTVVMPIGVTLTARPRPVPPLQRLEELLALRRTSRPTWSRRCTYSSLSNARGTSRRSAPMKSSMSWLSWWPRPGGG